MKEREGERAWQRKKKEEEHEGACERLHLWCAWERETVNDKAREFKRHGVCWLAERTQRVREVCDSKAWQVRQNKPAVTHGLLHSPAWSDPAGQPTIWDGTTYSSNQLDYIQDQESKGDGVSACVNACVWKRRCPEGSLNMLANEKRDVNRNLNRTVINVLQTQFLNK